MDNTGLNDPLWLEEMEPSAHEFVEAKHLTRKIKQEMPQYGKERSFPQFSSFWSHFVRVITAFNNLLLTDRDWKQEFQTYAAQYLEISKQILMNNEETQKVKRALETFEEAAMSYRCSVQNDREAEESKEALQKVETAMHQVLRFKDLLVAKESAIFKSVI